MGVYKRKDSPFWWLWLERPAPLRPIAKSSKIAIKAANAKQTAANRRLAWEAYHAEMSDLARSSYALPLSEPEAAKRTFREQADWYEQHKIPTLKREASRERETDILVKLRLRFGRLDLEDIDRELAAEYMTDRTKHVEASTVNREVDVLKAILQSAVPKHLKASALYGMKRLRTTAYEPRLLDRADEEKFLAELAVDDRALVLCGIDTLMRLSDILDLRRDRSGPVQDHGRFISVLDPKNNRPYRVPVSKRLRLALDKVGKRSPYYFARRRIAKTERDRRGTVRDMLEAACKRAGIDYGRSLGGVTFHTATRHTGASRMINDGNASLRTVQAIGDWKRLDMLTRYVHPSEASLLDAVESTGPPVAAAPPKAEDRIAALEKELTELRQKREADLDAARGRMVAVK